MTQPILQSIDDPSTPPAAIDASLIHWTRADLDLLPESSNRYEIVDGALFMTRAPHWQHQIATGNAASELRNWSIATGLGQAVQAPGIIFSDADNVIPDVVWISQERLATGLDQSGHLIVGPELIVEVLSAGIENERRDREAKLKLYSARGVQEYWIINWRSPQLEVYRRQQVLLTLVHTLLPGDTLTSPLLPGFSCAIERLFI
jgi:Uma2 family endonuclease